MRALTGLRAYAALWVVLFHLRHVLQPLLPEPLFEFCARGYLGVDLFFVLSGFVIAYRYGGHIGDGRAYRVYLIRRLGRIYPLHLATLLALVAAATLGRGTAIDISGSAYYVLDERLAYNLMLVHAWGLTNEASWNIPSWSISVEWFAYLVFPLLWWVVARVRTEGAALTGMAVAIVLTVFGLSALGEQWLHTSLQHRLARGVPEFFAGMFIFRLHALRGPPRRRWPVALRRPRRPRPGLGHARLDRLALPDHRLRQRLLAGSRANDPGLRGQDRGRAGHDLVLDLSLASAAAQDDAQAGGGAWMGVRGRVSAGRRGP